MEVRAESDGGRAPSPRQPQVREPSAGASLPGKRQRDTRTPVMYSAIRQYYCHDRHPPTHRISTSGALGAACKIHQCLYIDASEQTTHVPGSGELASALVASDTKPFASSYSRGY